MKEQDKKDFNEWINENFDNVKYVKLFINAFESAYFVISMIQEEPERNKTAFQFIETINKYIQEKKIQDIEKGGKVLDGIIKQVKIGIDAGFVDCMQVAQKNKERTAKATETRIRMKRANNNNDIDYRHYTEDPAERIQRIIRGDIR